MTQAENGQGCAPGLDEIERLALAAVEALPEAFRAPAQAVVLRVEDLADDGLLDRLKTSYIDRYRSAKQTDGKLASAEAVRALKEQAKAEIIPDPDAEGAVTSEAFSKAWHDLELAAVRSLILGGTRPDGRDHSSLRHIECETDILPRTHGSAVFLGLCRFI